MHLGGVSVDCIVAVGEGSRCVTRKMMPQALGRDQLEKFRRYLTRMKDAAGDLSDASVAQGVMGTLEKTEVHSYDGKARGLAGGGRARIQFIANVNLELHCNGRTACAGIRGLSLTMVHGRLPKQISRLGCWEALISAWMQVTLLKQREQTSERGPGSS